MKSASCMLFIAFAAFMFVQQVKCDGACQTTPRSGKIGPANLTIGNNCFNFTNTEFKYIVLKGVVLKDLDNITIKDNDNVTYTSTLQSRVPFLVVVGLINTTINIYTAKNESLLEISFSDDLTVDLTGIMTTTLYSPKYLPQDKIEKLINCTYILSNNLPSGTIEAVSVVNFKLDSPSSFTIKNQGNKKTGNSTSVPDDLFTSSTDSKIVVELNFNPKVQQELVLSVEAVQEECSGVQNLSTSPASGVKLFDKLSTSNAPYKCRVLLVSSSSDPAITIKVENLGFELGQGLMTIREGGSSHDLIHRYFYNNLEHGSTELFISSSKAVLVTLDVGVSSELKNISVRAILGLGEKWDKQGKLSVPKTEQSITRYWQLTADTGKLVKVDVTEIANARVTFFDGSQPIGNPITVLSTSNVYVNPVIGGDMLVKVEGTNLTKDVSASFSSVDKACDHLSTDVSGSHTFTPNGTNCVCSIYPYVDGTASNFNYIVLYIDTITLNDKETVEVISGLDKTEVAKFDKSVSQYQVIGSFKDGLRLVFKREGELKPTTQLSYHYESVSTVCGGNLTTDGKLYDLSTPNYPNQYPLNAKCEWIVPTKDDPKKLLINVEALNLAIGHSLTVSTGKDIKANYTGTTLPVSSLLVNANDTKIEFQTPGANTSVASGARLSYQSYDCGDNLGGKEGKLPLTTDQKECLWVIKIDEIVNKTIVLNVKLTPETKAELSDLSSLLIYDGPSINSKQLDKNLSAPVLSRENTIIVKGRPVKANVTLFFTTYMCNDTCQNGKCMHPDWKCNGVNDCGDNTDEISCKEVHIDNTTTPSPITTQKPEAADYSGWVKSGWVPACLAIGIIIGMVLYFAVPKIVRKIRGRGGNYSRMGDDRPVVT